MCPSVGGAQQLMGTGSTVMSGALGTQILSPWGCFQESLGTMGERGSVGIAITINAVRNAKWKQIPNGVWGRWPCCFMAVFPLSLISISTMHLCQCF